MNCGSREQSIALYVEGDLKDSERREIELHLQGCSSCRELANSLMSSLSLFKDLRQEMPQLSELSEVRQRVLNEVGDMQPAPGWVLIMHRLIFAGLRRKTAIAGLALVILTSGTLWFHQTPIKVEPSVDSSVELAQIESPSPAILGDIQLKTVAEPRKLNVVRSSKALIEAKPDISVKAPAEVPVAESASTSQVAMKFFTEDPDIIIYWLPADKGD